MSSAERYQRLPKQEDEHEESSPLGADGALDSLMTMATNTSTDSMEDQTVLHNNNNIFRSTPAWKAVPDRDNGGDVIAETASTTGSTTSSRRGNSNIGNGNMVSSASSSALNSNSNASQLHVMLNRSYSNDRSHHSGDSSNNSDEWDDDDDDVGAVRRYHLDFEQHNYDYNQRDNRSIPLPGGSSHTDSSREFELQSLPIRLWRSFLELRTTARQRRAARLLTMPSESFPYKLHACLLTTCCDATDRGILTVVAALTVWLFLGWACQLSAGWWVTGLLLFVMRVTARRLLESCLDANRKRMRRRQRLHTSEAAALEAESNVANASSIPVVADFVVSPDMRTTLTTAAASAAAAWGESDATTSLQQLV